MGLLARGAGEAEEQRFQVRMGAPKQAPLPT